MSREGSHPRPTNRPSDGRGESNQNVVLCQKRPSITLPIFALLKPLQKSMAATMTEATATPLHACRGPTPLSGMLGPGASTGVSATMGTVPLGVGASVGSPAEGAGETLGVGVGVAAGVGVGVGGATGVGVGGGGGAAVGGGTGPPAVGAGAGP